MRGGKGEEDYSSKGHKAFRLSFRARTRTRTMATESVWKFLLFFFFLTERFSEHSYYIPFKANKCLISQGN